MAGDDLEIVPALPEHAWELAPFLRAEDRREIWLAGHRAPLSAILASIEASQEAYTAKWSGQIGAIYGVAHAPELGAEVGCVWMLTGELLENRRRSFLAASRKEVARFLTRWSILFNLIADECQTALRWAEWAGFDIGQAIPWGPEVAPFHWVEIKRGAPCATLGLSLEGSESPPPWRARSIRHRPKRAMQTRWPMPLVMPPQ